MSTRTAIVARNTLWSGLDLALDLTVPILTSILVARAMGPSKLGEYGYILWVTQVALVFGSLGVPKAAARYLAQHLARGEVSEAGAILRLALRLQITSASVISLLGLGWALVKLPIDQGSYACVAMASVFPASLMGIATAVNIAREDLKANVLASMAGTLTQASCVLLTLVFHWDLLGLAVSLLASRTVDCVVRWALVRAQQPPGSMLLGPVGISLSAQKRREVLEFCWQATVLLTINLIVWNRSEMFFLKRFCDLRQIAFFSLAFTFATIPAQLAQPFTRAVTASLFAEQGRSESGAGQVAALMARYVFLLVLPAALGLAAISSPLVATLYGAQYAGAGPVLALAALFAFAAPLTEPAAGLLTAAGGQRALVRWGIIAAVITLALDLGLVRWQCAVGGAIANGCGQALSTFGVWVIARRRFGLSLPGRFLRSVSIAAGLAALVAFAATQVLSAVAALFVVPGLGVATYLTLLRSLKVLNGEDVRRFRDVAEILPPAMRPPCEQIIGWLDADTRVVPRQP